ncbi:MAG: response regulator [Oligoflexia bacterium]|nr:response regulator [Oligoflexia bacterium]
MEKTDNINTESRVLLIDDEEELLNILKMKLSSLFSVDTALNGQEALELINNNEYEVIVSDIKMPKLDGIELIKTLNQQGKTEIIPVIFLTGYANRQHAITALKHGAYDMLEKPFDFTVLEKSITRAITHKREMQLNKELLEYLSEAYNLLLELKNSYSERVIAAEDKLLSTGTPDENQLKLILKGNALERKLKGIKEKIKSKYGIILQNVELNEET